MDHVSSEGSSSSHHHSHDHWWKSILDAIQRDSSHDTRPPIATEGCSGADFVLATPVAFAQASMEDPTVSINIPRDQVRFEGAEHRLLGQSITLKNVKGETLFADTINAKLVTVNATVPFTESYNPLDLFITKTKPIDLYFGDIVALAGDFYTTYDRDRTPICGAFYGADGNLKARQQRFMSAVNSLLTDKDTNLIGLKRLLEKEVEGLGKAHDGTAAQAYCSPSSYNLPTDFDFGLATSITFDRKMLYKIWDKQISLYAWIAWLNADHFGNDAVLAYQTGHGVAMNLALEACSLQDLAAKESKLQLAYIHEAFAAHYLTDLFSSGHLRVPRRELHNNDWQQTLQAGIFSKLGGRKLGYDELGRIAHDNDNATGLLVENALGEQWIAYGDKQLEMPQNYINKCRAIDCLQASVDEIYKAFKEGLSLNEDEFVALKLLPKIQSSHLHNPAALLQVSDHAADILHCRRSLNDHSDFHRVPVSIDWNSRACTEIEHARFRDSSELFITTQPLAIKNGGFLQIQYLEQDSQTLLSLNVWNVTNKNLLNPQGDPKFLLTLQKRFMEFDKYPRSELKPLSWLKWSHGYRPLIFRIDWEPERHNIVASKWDIVPNELDQPGAEKFQQMHPLLSQAAVRQFQSNIGFQKRPIFTDSFLTQSLCVCTRYLVGNVAAQSTTDNPDLIAVVFGPAGDLTITVSSTNDCPEKQYRFSAAFTIGPAPWQHVKLFQSAQKGSQIMIANAVKVGPAETELKVKLFGINDVGEIVEMLSRVDMIETPKDFERPTILVGDIYRTGHDQIVLITSSGTKQHISILDPASSNSPWLLSKHCCGGDKFNDRRFVKHLFTALMPSDRKTSNSQLQIITGSLVTDSQNKYRINFRIHDLNAQLDHCTECEPLKDCTDEFHERFANGNYFPLRYLRCSSKWSRNAILEVFSYYGVLGVRLFSPKVLNSLSYEMVGQIPFMGQTSIAMGLGCEGNWGYGILPCTWGSAQEGDFIDVKYTKQVGRNLDESIWDEVERNPGGKKLIPGFEVWERPFVVPENSSLS